MKTGQGLPVNMIVLTALALLVLVVVGAFFISGFGSAGASVQVVNQSQAQCQSLCQGIATSAFNYDSCGASGLQGNPQVTQYTTTKGCARDFGACRVTIKNGVSCSCSTTGCV